MSARILTVFLKEVLDNLRDRRSWMLSLVFAALGPAMLVAIIAQVSRATAGEGSKPLVVAVDGEARAPALMAFLLGHNVRPTTAPPDAEAAVRAGTVDFVLEVPTSYGDDLAAGRPATVRIVYDDSRTFTASGVRRLRDLLNAYGATVAQVRLLARGISPQITRPLAVENHNLATPQARAAFVFSLVPMFVLMSVFLGGMYVAIDATAGERERGSLEPLLATPLSSAELVLGKLLAVAAYAMASVLITSTAFMLVLNLVPLDVPGLRLGLPLGRFAVILGLLVPAVPAAASLEMLVVSRQRTFKEAQTTMQFLTLLPMVPGLVSVFSSTRPPAWSSLVPFLGQHALIDEILRGEPLHPRMILGNVLVTLLAAALAALITVRRYDRERVLFG